MANAKVSNNDHSMLLYLLDKMHTSMENDYISYATVLVNTKNQGQWRILESNYKMPIQNEPKSTQNHIAKYTSVESVV